MKKKAKPSTAVLSIVILSAVLITTTLVSPGCKSVTRPDSGKQQPSNTSKKDSISKTGDSKGLKDNTITHYQTYEGAWKQKIDSDGNLYMFTSLDVYFGGTWIKIKNVDIDDKIEGTVESYQGAPSYRQAIVPFSGEIKNDKMIASYNDENWENSGKIELTFKPKSIDANITRDKTEAPSMWGIPEGKFTFIRPINTRKINLSEKEKSDLEQFLMPFSKDAIKPFDKGELTDNMIIEFIGTNLGAGFLDIQGMGDRIKENGSQIVFGKQVMDDLSEKYFGQRVKKHKAFKIVGYKKSAYSVPALGGITESPLVRMMIKDKVGRDTYYAITDFVSENPEDGKKPEYEYLIELQELKEGKYVVKAIHEIKNPIDFEALK